MFSYYLYSIMIYNIFCLSCDFGEFFFSEYYLFVESFDVILMITGRIVSWRYRCTTLINVSSFSHFPLCVFLHLNEPTAKYLLFVYNRFELSTTVVYLFVCMCKFFVCTTFVSLAVYCNYFRFWTATPRICWKKLLLHFFPYFVPFACLRAFILVLSDSEFFFFMFRFDL